MMEKPDCKAELVAFEVWSGTIGAGVPYHAFWLTVEDATGQRHRLEPLALSPDLARKMIAELQTSLGDRLPTAPPGTTAH